MTISNCLRIATHPIQLNIYSICSDVYYNKQYDLFFVTSSIIPCEREIVTLGCVAMHGRVTGLPDSTKKVLLCP